MKISNFQYAMYISENYGDLISDEKLKYIAEKMKLKPNVLIKNYKSIIKINEMLKFL